MIFGSAGLWPAYAHSHARLIMNAGQRPALPFKA